MSGPTDLLLPRPLPLEAIQFLRFAAFTLHMLFVLVTLGTGILSIAYFFQIWWLGRRNELRWDREILRTFVGHKSLAVVLGVGPLLLLQVGHPTPFFAAVNLFAPAWLLVIVLLVVAFLCMDCVGQRLEVNHGMHLVLGLVGLMALLAVPGIFVAVLVGAENPQRWSEIAANDHRLPGDLGWHWLARYLHVLGASVVVGGLVHYFWSQPGEVHKRKSLLRWIVGAMLAQFVLGAMLYASMPARDAGVASGAARAFGAAVLLGAAAGAWLLAVLLRAMAGGRQAGLAATVFPTVVLLASMLLARQLNQDRVFVPLTRAADARAEAMRRELAPFEAAALAEYRAEARRTLDGRTLYEQSCAFCHGQNADGRAPAAAAVAIAPENLAEMRTTRGHLRAVLLAGVPGTAMPRFGYFTSSQLEEIIDELDRRHGILGPCGPFPREIPESAREEARRVFAAACSVCHRPDGRPTPFAGGFEPPPPDLAVHSMTPRRAFEVVTEGYPGTEMPSFRRLPADVRWALAEIVVRMRAPSQR